MVIHVTQIYDACNSINSLQRSKLIYRDFELEGFIIS
jgi:hypothetical protein